MPRVVEARLFLPMVPVTPAMPASTAQPLKPRAPSIAANPVIAWALTEGWTITRPDQLTARLGMCLVAAGIPVVRLRVLIRTLHPQYLGANYLWRLGSDSVETTLPPHTIVADERFRKSPYAALFEGAGGIRRRLEGPAALFDYPVLLDLKNEGATDYVAMPLQFSDGRISALTVASNRSGGFAASELERLYEALPVLAHLYELHTLRLTAATILDTYLGHHTGERVLKGLIRRGDGEEIHAVIWFCDLRGSTALADSLPRRDYLDTLNAFFDAMAGAVLEHKGEVLSFIGDGALAIFPIMAAGDACTDCPQHQTVAANALATAEDAISRVERLNAQRASSGLAPLGFGIALHLGDVMYGNIGTPQRLAFTVIGTATNEAARIEGLCGTLGQPLLMSAAFARFIAAGPAGDRVLSLGVHALRGVRQPMEIFALAPGAQPG